MPAPTASFIESARFRLSISCDTCRVLRMKDPMALIIAGKGDVPVDQLKFRCEICGSPGVPYVHGHDVELGGQKRFWPP